MSGVFRALSVFFLVLCFALGATVDGQQCGEQAGGKVCHNNLCCSSAGYCGITEAYCGDGCQSQCHDLPNFVNETTYKEMFPHQNDANCTSHSFYTHEAFLKPVFGNFKRFARVGDDNIRKREIAAFLAQTSYATTADVSEDEVDDPYAWGYCILSELNPPSSYCDPHFSCPKEYYGRGPFQLQWNYNYEHAGEEIGGDLLNEPDLLTKNATTSFESAYWRWMTPKSSTKPSCHDAMVGAWNATEAEIKEFKWYSGFGLTTNILNGVNECGQGPTVSGEKRIRFYKRYCDMIGVDYGDHLDCYDQTPLSGASLATVVKTM